LLTIGEFSDDKVRKAPDRDGHIIDQWAARTLLAILPLSLFAPMVFAADGKATAPSEVIFSFQISHTDFGWSGPRRTHATDGTTRSNRPANCRNLLGHSVFGCCGQTHSIDVSVGPEQKAMLDGNFAARHI